MTPLHYSNLTWQVAETAVALNLEPEHSDGDNNPFVGFYMSLDRSFFLDMGTGLQPFIYGVGTVVPPPVSLPAQQAYGPIALPMFLCYDVPPGHWKTLMWDPQMTVLFGNDPTPSSSPFEASPTAKSIAWVAAPVVVGVTAAAVIGFIVFYMHSPKLQRTFQPHRRDAQAKPNKREANQEAANAHEAPVSASNAWAKADKPPQTVPNNALDR